MTEVLGLVAARVDADDKLSDEASLLVLAALEGDAALADMAGYERPPSEPVETDPVEPAGAYLRQIAVRGFRGIGDEVTLALNPGPGLTVVAGRNGSGKSSFSEALELALTGTTTRFQRSTQWTNCWRNLHCSDKPQIRLSITEEGAGVTTVGVNWPDSAELNEATRWVQRSGAKRQPGVDSLGWDEPLTTYRPLLTYDELGNLVSAVPSELYDAITPVLGLQQITDAIGRLASRSKLLSQPQKDLTDSKKRLLATLGQIDDERARSAEQQLRKHSVDVTELRRLASGAGRTGQDDLRRLLTVSLPSEEECAAAAERLTAAVSKLADAGDRATESLERRNAVLAAAVALHQHTGDSPCPVCGQGVLDAELVATLGEELTSDRAELETLRRARQELNAARQEADRIVGTPPAALTGRVSDESIDELRGTVLQAWQDWSHRLDDDLARADQLRDRRETVRKAVAELHRRVEQVLGERDDVWAGAATALGTHADLAERWQQVQHEAGQVKEAHTWLKNHDIELKNERLRPIGKSAADIWKLLRQESNVEMAGLSLEGSATRRRVEIRSAVDGVEAGGLSVLSQGELHAIALALFLPRATLPESPFRFVVLDDPVQAMDPAKVDGLVAVLADIARTRQVIVFSHDDRLSNAVRRAHVDARVLEVSRSTGSRVTVRHGSDPATRYLHDARALTKDEGLPEGTKRRVLPGLLRFAVEAAARDRYFADELAGGATHDQVERAWTNTHTSKERVALALGRTDLTAWAGRRGGERAMALGVIARAFHQGMRGDPDGALVGTRNLIQDLREGR